MGRGVFIPWALACAFVATGASQERPLPEFKSFSAKVRDHLATDEERQSGYVFTERRIEQKVDGSGKVTDESVKVFEVYPGLEGEERYRRRRFSSSRRWLSRALACPVRRT